MNRKKKRTSGRDASSRTGEKPNRNETVPNALWLLEWSFTDHEVYAGNLHAICTGDGAFVSAVPSPPVHPPLAPPVCHDGESTEVPRVQFKE